MIFWEAQSWIFCLWLGFVWKILGVENKIRILKLEGRISKPRVYKVLRNELDLSKEETLRCIEKLDVEGEVEIIFDLSTYDMDELIYALVEANIYIPQDCFPSNEPSYDHLNDHDFWFRIMGKDKISTYEVKGGVIFHKPSGSAIIVELDRAAKRIVSIIESQKNN